MTQWFYVSASQARGPGFESGREHSSFSLKSPDFVPEAPRVAFSGMGQARIENNLFIYLYSSVLSSALVHTWYFIAQNPILYIAFSK